MEKMEDEYRTLFKDVSPSVVLVDQVGHIDYFCIGSVILSEGESTFILTQSRIAKPPVNLSVRFSNGFKQPATLLVDRDNLCVLVTKYYPKAKVVQFFEGDIDHSYAAAIAPASKSSVYNIPGFIMQRSLQSVHRSDGSDIPDSEDFFIFTCRYGDKSPNRVSRLVSGPVFHLDSQAVGLVVDDLEYKFYPQKSASLSQIYHEKFYVEVGFFLKVVMRVSRLLKILSLMAEDDDWRKGLKQMALKVKVAT